MEITKIKVNGIVYDIADKEAVEALERQLAAEKQRAEEAERALGNAVASAARVDGNAFVATADEVKLTTTGVDATKQYPVTLPAATKTRAGVMSAADKAKLDNITTGGDVTTEQLEEVKTDAIEKGRQLALRSLFVAAGAEYNDTDNHIVKNTPWKDYVDSNEYKAQWNLDVVTGSVQTLTYGGKSYEYVDDNGTWKIVARVGDKLIWDDTKVIHRKGYYYLNGLGDIAEGEMIEIYNKKEVMKHLDLPRLMQSESIPVTLFGLSNSHSFLNTPVSYSLFANGNSKLKVVFWVISQNTAITAEGLSGNNSNADLSYTFSGCSLLRYVGRIEGKRFSKYTVPFSGCESLSCVIIYSMKGNVSFNSSKAISKACILYIIQNAAPTTAITLTLHHDAYVRLTSDEDIINALDAKNAALTEGGKISLVCATHSDAVTPNA